MNESWVFYCEKADEIVIIPCGGYFFPWEIAAIKLISQIGELVYLGEL